MSPKTAGGAAGRGHSRRRSEIGLAAPMVVAGMSLLATLALAVGLLGELLADQRRSATAADLAALAAATAIQRGQEPCAAAERSAGDNGARLDSCSVDGDRVRVEASVESATVLGRTLEVSAAAHAGPVG